MTVETIKYIIGLEEVTDEQEIRNRLDEAEVVYTDHTEEYGYFNLRIPSKDGYIRVYDYNGEYRVVKFTKTVVKLSGVPTFEPSGRRSF